MPERSVSTDRELSWSGVSTKQLNEHTNAFRDQETWHVDPDTAWRSP